MTLYHGDTVTFIMSKTKNHLTYSYPITQQFYWYFMKVNQISSKERDCFPQIVIWKEPDNVCELVITVRHNARRNHFNSFINTSIFSYNSIYHVSINNFNSQLIHRDSF